MDKLSTTDVQKMMFDTLNELNIDVNSDVILAELFFSASLIEKLTQGAGDLQSQDVYRKFENELRKYQIDYFIHYDFNTAAIDAFDRLLKLMRGNNLFDFQTFMRLLSPWMVADWDAFEQALENRSMGKKIAGLIYILKCRERLGVPESDLFDLDPDEVYAGHVLTEGFWPVTLRFTTAQFSACWNAVHFFELKHIPVQVRGHLNDAIKAYKKNYAKLQKLLSDVLIVKNRNYGNQIIHPWAYEQKIKKMPIERGVTEAEILFENAALLLKDKLPTDIIRAVFYPKSRNDSALECSFLPRLFPKVIPDGQKVLIVNPSPDLILLWETEKGMKKGTMNYAVTDKTVANLYKKQFPSRTFVPFSSIKHLGMQDNILIICRDLRDEMLNQSLAALSRAGKGSRVFAVLPNALFDSSKLFLRELLEKNGCSIRDILVLRPGLTNSSPKKKLLVRFEKTSQMQPVNDVRLFSTFVQRNNSDIRMLVSMEQCWISQDKLLAGNQTLLALQKRELKAKNAPAIVKRRNAAERYEFSKEIVLHYTIQSDRKGRFAGKAYYCAILRDGEPRKQSGKRLTNIIEKGLRAKTRGEVLSNIEWTAFDERVDKKIVGDIESCYVGRMNALSLKTIWFCCRDTLEKKSNYEEGLAKQLFCGGNRQLANLCPGNASESDFQVAMESILEGKQASGQLQYWRCLELVIKTAVELKFLRFNPIGEIVRAFSNQATREQQEVRNALVKKTFSHEEEEKILAFIYAETEQPIGPRLAKRYEADSLCLGGAIRFFTGMAAKELCALTWKDFVCVPGHEKLYQLLVKGFVAVDGTIEKEPRESDWKKFRRVPIAPALAEMLLSRKQYLQVTHSLAEEELAGQPIILAQEYTKRRRPKGVTFCRPRILANACKTVVAAANIPEQLVSLPDEDGQLVTDIFKYQGDIFQSNFKYRANHTCALRRGEINYILGVEPPDTFSRNYCDYTNDFIQYAMSRKLQRWTALHTQLSPESKAPYMENNYLKMKSKRTFAPVTGVMLSVEMQLELGEECAGGTLTIETECEFACSGSVTLFCEGG